MPILLDVKDLKTRFHTPEGTVYAVNGISFHVDEGETLAVVGESGCGKSVSMLSVLQLIPVPPGDIAGGVVSFRGQDLLKNSEREMEDIRGREIAMIFQDPMTSLNPVLTIGRQITESLRVPTLVLSRILPTPGQLNCWMWLASRTHPVALETTPTSFPAECASE